MTGISSPITDAWLALDPSVRSQAERIAGHYRHLTWPETLLLIATAIVEERERHQPTAPNRVDFAEDGTLDEVYASKGAHLEHMGSGNWFLIFYHEDGSGSAFWFKCKELLRPNWETYEAKEKRPPPAPLPSSQEKGEADA